MQKPDFRVPAILPLGECPCPFYPPYDRDAPLPCGKGHVRLKARPLWAQRKLPQHLLGYFYPPQLNAEFKRPLSDPLEILDCPQDDGLWGGKLCLPADHRF